MRRFPRFRIVPAASFALLFLAVPGLFAEESPPAEKSPFSFSMTASIGTETVKGENFQSLGLMPDFGYGPLGVGIDLSIHFRFYETPGGTFGFYPRPEDWWDGSLTQAQNIDKYLSRLLYVRWGHKGDPLYVQAGLLPSTTLGSGFVVGGYNNGALRPSLKYTGLEVDASGELVGAPFVGFESFVGNLTAFDVLGARAWVKPFSLTNPDDPFLKEIQFGVTAAADTNPYAQTPSSYTGTRYSGGVTAFGVDSMVPLYASDLATAVATADVAVQGSHTGGAIGVGGKALVFLRWSLQTRLLGDNFLPDYFDRAYEANRATKFVYYNNGLSVPGTFGWVASLGAGFLEDKISFGAQMTGPFSEQTAVLAQPQLSSWATLKAGVLPIALDAFYVKNGVTSFGSLVSPKDALIGAKVGYSLGAATLSVIYDLRYVAEGESGSNGNSWVSTSRVETAVKF